MPATNKITTDLTPVPSRAAPSTFSAYMDAFLAKLPTWATQANALADEADANADTASAAAYTATIKAGLTENDAIATAADRVQTGLDVVAAAASAASAAAIAGAFVGTSTTSLAIGTGTKTFVTQAGEQYTAGIWMTAVSAADGNNWMFGQVVSYSGTSLELNVQAIGGSGTFADWNLSLTGARGPAGEGITAQTVGFIATGGITPKTLTVDENFTVSTANISKTYTAPKYTRDDDGTVSGGTWAIDYANGPVIKATAGANITSITMSNWPASGTEGHLRLKLVNFGAYTITFPASWNWVKSDLTTTTTFNNLGLALPSSGTAEVDLTSDDGGTSYRVSVRR